MIVRITYCTVALMLCIVIGLLFETPEHLIAETEQDQIRTNESPEEYLLRSHAAKTFKKAEQDRLGMTSQPILNEAHQRELDSNERFQQAPLPRIVPASVSHRSRNHSLTITPLQKSSRRNTGLRSRNSGSIVITSTSTPEASEPNRQLDQSGLSGTKGKQSQPLPALPKQEVITAMQLNAPAGRVVLSGAKSASAETVPAGFLSSPKPNSDDEGKKSSLSIFKRAIKGLNRRSEPQTGANHRSQSSAPRRFIPTNPKPVSQDEAPGRQAGESTTQGTIVQAQQNSAITRELKKLYRKDGRQMPQTTTPNLSRVPQGTATNQGFAPSRIAPGTSRIAPGNSSGNQQPANNRKKAPIWKRLFSIGRRKQPQQNQQPQYNPQPQQLQQPQFGQQSQFYQQPSSQKLPLIPSSAPNYATRNKSGISGTQSPAASPYSRNIPTFINRTPRPFPGNTPSMGYRNSQQLQSPIPKQRRINGDAPQFDSFSDQFDPFAIPQEITKPETSPVNSVDVQSQNKSNPFSDEFNPFEEPEVPVDTQTQNADLPQPSTTNPFSNIFDPFAGSEIHEDSDNVSRNKESEPADTTQAKKISVTKPTKKIFNPFQEPKELEPKNLAPAPPVSEVDEQTRGGNSSEGGVENAFPDLSETEADRNNPDENPFTGLKLNDKPEDRNEYPVVPAPQKTVPDAGKDDLRPSFDPQNTAENSTGNTSKNTTQTTDNTPTHPIIITPPVAPKLLETQTGKNVAGSPNIEVNKKSEVSKTHRNQIDLKQKRDKLKKITERYGLKGFKGFCPVALRDQQKLINSKSEFKSIYDSRIYFFSSSQARDSFESTPEHYAPAHGGKDIVMLRKDEKKVQGSLDHAVWFQNRLYMFSSADSLKTFIKTPKRYLKNSSENKAGSDKEQVKDSGDSTSDDVSYLFFRRRA